jgi:hypothetical protein
VIETRSKQKTKITKKNQTIHTKMRCSKNNDLKKPSEKSHRLQMSFTGVPAQSDRREKNSGLISSSQQQKLKNNEEGHKI